MCKKRNFSFKTQSLLSCVCQFPDGDSRHCDSHTQLRNQCDRFLLFFFYRFFYQRFFGVTWHESVWLSGRNSRFESVKAYMCCTVTVLKNRFGDNYNEVVIINGEKCDTGGGQWKTRKTPTCKLHTERSCSSRESNLKSSCYEATVLTTDPLCHLILKRGSSIKLAAQRNCIRTCLSQQSIGRKITES